MSDTELTPVRKWIIKQLTELLPSETSEIRSDTNGALFTQWTRMSHLSLTSTWIQEDTQRAVNNIAGGQGDGLKLLSYQGGASVSMANAKYWIEKRSSEYDQNAKLMSGSQPFKASSLVKVVGTTTSCNAFLGVLVEKILAAGSLSKRNFPSFDLPKAGGAAWNFFPNAEKAMKPGDFYELGKRVKVGNNGERYEFKHVGIIFSAGENSWETADGGQGGPSVGFDRIKRKKLNASDSILGFIDADRYFANWRGPGTEPNQ